MPRALSFSPEVDIVAPPPSPSTCNELGRVTRSYVSGFVGARRETRSMRRFARRCLVADFNGALDPSRTITHVRWDCTSPWIIFMENARVMANGREVAVDVSFNYGGYGAIMATVTLDNGEVYNQDFAFSVRDAPLYPAAVYQSNTGPYVLEADA